MNDAGIQYVRYTGSDPSIPFGTRALMRRDGKVQLNDVDGDKVDARCYDWHDLGEEWTPLTGEDE